MKTDEKTTTGAIKGDPPTTPPTNGAVATDETPKAERVRGDRTVLEQVERIADTDVQAEDVTHEFTVDDLLTAASDGRLFVVRHVVADAANDRVAILRATDEDEFGHFAAPTKFKVREVGEPKRKPQRVVR